MDVIDVIDEAYKEFLDMAANFHGRGNGKTMCEITGVTYVTAFVNYLKGKIEDEYSDDRK